MEKKETEMENLKDEQPDLVDIFRSQTNLTLNMPSFSYNMHMSHHLLSFQVSQDSVQCAYFLMVDFALRFSQGSDVESYEGGREERLLHCTFKVVYHVNTLPYCAVKKQRGGSVLTRLESALKGNVRGNVFKRPDITLRWRTSCKLFEEGRRRRWSVYLVILPIKLLCLTRLSLTQILSLNSFLLQSCMSQPHVAAGN